MEENTLESKIEKLIKYLDQERQLRLHAESELRELKKVI